MSAAQLDSAVATSPAPLTILHVTAPAAFGGLERVVEALAAGHARSGHAVHVAAVIGPADPAPTMVRTLESAGVATHVLRVPARRYLAERAFIGRLCRQLRPDVVHTHGFRSDVVDGAIARRHGIPAVTTVHGFTRNAGRGRLYEWLQRRSHARFDAVVAVSEAQTIELMAAGVPRSSLSVVRNAWAGSTELLPVAEARTALGVPLDAPHIGWVGRLSPEKGPDLFLEAVARCRTPGLRASIIGDGRMRAELESQAQALGVADRVRFCGQVEDAGRYFASFDVFVMSSHTEGAPIVLFEAMAGEIPVVATAVGGIPEIAGAGEALLVPAGDPGALAEAIDALLADPERCRIQTRAATQTLGAKYSADQWLAQYETLYRRLRAQKRNSRETVS